MATNANVLKTLLDKKKVLKTKLTKHRNYLLTSIKQIPDQEDLQEDVNEFNRIHRELKEHFEHILECSLTQEEIDKYVDEQIQVKLIYRETKKRIQSFIKNNDLNCSFSTVFSSNIPVQEAKMNPRHSPTITSDESPFKGFGDDKTQDKQDKSSEDSYKEYLSMNDSEEARKIPRSSTPNSSIDFEKVEERLTKIVYPTTTETKTPERPKLPSFQDVHTKKLPLHDNFVSKTLQIPSKQTNDGYEEEQRRFGLQCEAINRMQQNIDIQREEVERQRRLLQEEKKGLQPQILVDTFSTLRLEPLPLPTFDGSFDKWLTFQNMFESMVYNNKKMSIIEKFQRLKNALVGPATTFVENIELSEENFETVWNEMRKEFNDPRRIITAHIQSMINLPAMTNPNATEMKKILDQFKSHKRALFTSGVDENAEIFQLHILLSKFDVATQQKWEKKLTGNKDIPTLSYFYEIIEKRIRTLQIEPEANPVSTQVPVPIQRKNSNRIEPIRRKSSLHAKTIKCYLCDKDHLVFKCPELNQASPNDRLRMINDKKLCLNCFSINHQAVNCKSGNCRVKDCNQKHNTLLHDAMKKGSSMLSTLIAKFGDTLLATAIVVINVNGKSYTARALLDGGSQCCFMTSSFCDEIELQTQPELIDISGIGKSSHEVNRSVVVTLSSYFCSYSTDISCLVMTDITEKMPQAAFDIKDWKIPSSVRLADPEFNKPSKIDVLLSASVFFDILLEGIINLGPEKPKLFNTQLGWLVAGGGNSIKLASNPTPKSFHVISKKSLSSQIEQFWELESFPEEKKIRSIEDETCESHFVKTSRRINSRFVVELPFKSDPLQLRDNNRARAESCWLSTERRFDKDEQIHTLYNDFMMTYIKLGHMRETKEKIQYYIPHHHVFKPGTNEKKFRVVFNASSKTRDNISLNDLLYVGPSIQDDLFDVILRFREHPIAISGDIEKMYRQVMVSEEDQKYQGIIWREDKNQPLKSYKLCTLTYGTGPAAFIATRCIQRIAELDGLKYEKAAKVIVRDFYMDDLLTSCKSEEEAIELREQVQEMLQNNGMPMRKWVSNSDVVLQSIPEAFRGIEGDLDMQLDETIKTLGMHWSPKEDKFIFKSTNFGDIHTKRTVISDIAKIFDPNGLLGPIVFKAKCFMQTLWRRHVSWDELLVQDLDEVWQSYKQSMRHISDIKIDRCLTLPRPYIQLQLFGFSDASELGYGACVYLVSTLDDETIHSKLVCSKSRVAPLKTQSIPRLELCGALLLAELMSVVEKALMSKIDNKYYFSDSKIVLSWLAKEASAWKVFTANRVSKIQTLTPAESWHHVKSEQNPADLVSRGVTAEELKSKELWWEGPKQLFQIFCHEQQLIQPIIPDEDELSIVQEEKKQIVLVAPYIIPSFVDELFRKKSKLHDIVRYICLFRRIAHNYTCKTDEEKIKDFIKYQEIVAARQLLARFYQEKHYTAEYHALKKGSPIPSNSSILPLNPVWDEKTQLIKVGGRISRAKLPEPRKHQIILPANCIFTQRLFEMTHRRLLHAGPQLTLSEIRNEWWPVSGKKLARRVCNDCVTCCKRSPKMLTQIMGDLPECRVNPSKPFMCTGLDFAGPFKTKQNEGPRCKQTRESYICIFVCCSTKAVHLEVVSSYTSEAFIACLRRFVARRGKLRHIYCDNGTNFVGGHNILRKMLNEKSKLIGDEFEHLEFHFAPARSPHTGGLYESNVRSMKKHLTRAMGTITPNFEEFQTILTQIEACMNSRPLVALPSDVEEVKVLTPGHFLTGDSLTALPDLDYTDTNINSLTRWYKLQHLIQTFWHLWSQDYLNSLQQRWKWQKISANLEKDDVVILKDDNLKPLYWKLGRVTNVFPDKNDAVRIVELITNGHLTKRTIHKLAKLPVKEIPWDFGGRNVYNSKN